MSAWDRIAENKIREAISEGKFEGLTRGHRVDLEEYFKLPEDLRMAYSIPKSAGCVPEEVEHLQDVDRIQTQIDQAPDEATRASLRRSLADAQLRLRLALDRAKRR
jgi:hypothetical protein